MGKHAPEFSSLRGWLNSPPLTITSLNGKVVFLDFWTYSCVNCIRTLPHMKELYKRFSGEKFVLVGVHTPEFAFEKDPENVASAVKRFGIEYPVAIDSENVTWKLYGNQYWPRQTLVDATGRVRWEHAGEGDYDKMGEQIMSLLKEAGETVSDSASKEKTRSSWKEKLGLESNRITPEIYAGSLRSKGFGNGQTNIPGTSTKFVDSREHEQDIPYLSGDWIQNPEFVTHVTPNTGYIALRYTARNANAVLGSSSGKPARVTVELDGHALEKGRAGADVQWERDASYLTVSDNRLYDIVRTKNNETHELKLVTDSEGLCLYTYTFG
jgi:thiol-disulfide isomerase/thioredoxin